MKIKDILEWETSNKVIKVEQWDQASEDYVTAHNYNEDIAGQALYLTLASNSVLTIEVHSCCDNDMQEVYERRLLTSHLNRKEFIMDSILFIQVKKIEVMYDLISGIVFIEEGMPYHITEINKEWLLSAAYFPRTNISGVAAHTCMKLSIKDNRLRVDLVEHKDYPVWLLNITDKADTYENPLNKNIAKQMHFRALEDAYWGINLFYHATILAMVNLNGIWVRIPPQWLKRNIDTFPELIKTEFYLMSEINKHK